MMDAMLEETAARILADRRHSRDALWATLEENGLTRVWVSESDGGFAMAPADGFGLIRLAGAFAAPAPLAETLAATWFLGEAGLRPPSGPMSFVIDGFQRGIPFGDSAAHIVRMRGKSVSLHSGQLPATMAGIGEDPLADASALNGSAIAMGETPSECGLLMAALARSAQICGALDAALTLTIGFAEQREQFGRSLSKFQAIQHLLSEMGAEAAAASAALDAAVATVAPGKALNHAAIAVAKCRASIAAGIVCEHAHQVHGAIGYTQEYELARLSRRLWRWREDFGGESYWASELGRAALSDAAPLWPKLADGALGPVQARPLS